MPRRADLDPVEMRPWLSHLQLVDVFHNPRRMIYRLVGELDVQFRGYNPTGRSVEECCIGVSRDETLKNFDLVIEGRQPLYDWGDYTSQSGLIHAQEELLLPLSEDDDIVNMIVTYAEVDAGG
jgi:hypothetical protein